jgi:hypothetical protein
MKQTNNMCDCEELHGRRKAGTAYQAGDDVILLEVKCLSAEGPYWVRGS